MARPHLRPATLRLALALRAWVVVLLAFPAFGFAASPPAAAAAAFEPASVGLETVARAAPPVPVSEGRPVDAAVAAESEEEEDAEGRHAPHVRGLLSGDVLAFGLDAARACTAIELVVPSTPQLEHRLHNRGPPLA